MFRDPAQALSLFEGLGQRRMEGIEQRADRRGAVDAAIAACPT